MYADVVLICRIHSLAAERIEEKSSTDIAIETEIQRKIQAYDKQLTQWTATLPSQFDLPSWKEYPHSEPFRAALAILSYSTRTIINRPALCRTERQIRGQSEESVETSHDAAQRCVHAARAMLQFLPGEPKGTNLRQSPLWWVCI